MYDLTKQTFATTEIANVAAQLNIPLGMEALKTWIRRGVVDGGRPGRGHCRRWSLGEVVSILCLAYLRQRMPSLPGRDQTALAFLPTALFSNRVASYFDRGLDGWEDSPLFVLVNRSGWPILEPIPDLPSRDLAVNYSTRGAMLLHPGAFAADLAARLSDVIGARNHRS